MSPSSPIMNVAPGPNVQSAETKPSSRYTVPRELVQLRPEGERASQCVCLTQAGLRCKRTIVTSQLNACWQHCPAAVAYSEKAIEHGKNNGFKTEQHPSCRCTWTTHAGGQCKLTTRTGTLPYCHQHIDLAVASSKAAIAKYKEENHIQTKPKPAVPIKTEQFSPSPPPAPPQPAPADSETPKEDAAAAPVPTSSSSPPSGGLVERGFQWAGVAVVCWLLLYTTVAVLADTYAAANAGTATGLGEYTEAAAHGQVAPAYSLSTDTAVEMWATARPATKFLGSQVEDAQDFLTDAQTLAYAAASSLRTLTANGTAAAQTLAADAAAMLLNFFAAVQAQLHRLLAETAQQGSLCAAAAAQRADEYRAAAAALAAATAAEAEAAARAVGDAIAVLLHTRAFATSHLYCGSEACAGLQAAARSGNCSLPEQPVFHGHTSMATLAFTMFPAAVHSQHASI